MLTRFPTVLLQPLGHLSGKLRFSRAPCRCFQWRRERDSNPRYAYAYSGFRDRPIQPLSHLSAGENTRIAAAFPPRKSVCILDFAAFREYNHPEIRTRQEGYRVPRAAPHTDSSFAFFPPQRSAGAVVDLPLPRVSSARSRF